MTQARCLRKAYFTNRKGSFADVHIHGEPALQTAPRGRDGAYLISLFAAEYLISRDLVQGPLVWALALIPGLAVTAAFYAVGMLIIEQKDEFLRMLIVRQVLIATGFALSIATVWGFLENFDLVPHVDSYWVGILWFLGFGIGGFVNKRTMGAWGECG